MKNKLIHSFIFLLLFIVLDRSIGAFLEVPKEVLIKDMKYDPYWRWKEFKQQPEGSLDLIFLGSSHCYRSFNPVIFDESLGLRTMNMGSSAQTPLTSYYVLQEILQKQKPKYLVLELYWITFGLEDQLANAIYNFQYMSWGRNKIDFFLHAYKLEDIVTLLMPSFYYKKNLENAIHHFQGKNVSWASGDHYVGKGYLSNPNVTSTEELLKTNQFKNFVFDKKKILPVHLRYLEKIVQLCQEHGIRLIFVTSPLPPTSLAMIKDYHKIHDYFMAIAQKNNIPYIDYNVADYKINLPDDDFKDDDHLNSKGVVLFDRDFADRLLGLL